MWTRICVPVLALVGCAAAALPAQAASQPRSFAFETDKWFSLDDAKQGPITWHRIQVVHQKGGLGKSTIFRPGNADYTAPIELRIEFSNAATHDYNGLLQIVLVDEAGRKIDGFHGKQELESEQKYQVLTIKLTTLKYGLERARQLRVTLDSEPD